ncbi:embryo-specific protein ATS3B-like [Abrus precatorius]|uniref:Embryo-specific protein ATS3B-like n=1 Tax=Abrus precatorius TaxID=3816 RepID=A0A8B8KI09_ABRPR|nr:embryo-specific protein ATS3B-like [Abrus precatorius]
MNALTVILIFTFCIITAFSHAMPTATKPKPIESFKLNQTQQQKEGGSCSYTLTIKTSCSSYMYTTEIIGVLFGDAYGNQVYVPSLDGPNLGTFGQCSTNTYEIYGPCTFQICDLYLYRTGDDGWIPETVTVYDYAYDPITFYYNINIPDDDGYGFDYCHGV